jgi:glycine dehydrogenase subunit 1
VHPYYRQTVHTIVTQQNIQLIDVPYHPETGKTDLSALNKLLSAETAALVIPQPNFFGVLDDVDALTDWAHEKNILSIAVVNPMAMALLKAPGQWGKHGVDIACGEGQPLGIPLASGGPYYGFLCGRKSQVRQMPGRIVGRTVDNEGKTGFVLTLQAREQHIRRGKATSNAEVVFNAPFFHEVVSRFKQPAKQILRELSKRGIQGGFALGDEYPGFENCLLVCATETKTKDDIDSLSRHLREVLEGRKQACPV